MQVIRHRIFDECVRLVLRILHNPGVQTIVRVCGLTGVGKSEIVAMACRAFTGSPSHWAPNTLPVSWVRAGREEGGRFSSKAHSLQTLMSVLDPDLLWLSEEDRAGLLDKLSERMKIAKEEPFWKGMRNSGPEYKLRLAFCDQTAARQTLWHVIDDAHEMCAVTENQRPSAFLQPWLRIARKGGPRLVLCGTTAMDELVDGQGEASRQSHRIYVPRYDPNIAEDRKEFAAVLAALARQFRFDSFSARVHGELLHKQTVGVIGEAVALFERARVRAEADGREAIAYGDIQAAGPNPTEYEGLLDRLRHFEDLAKPVTDDQIRMMYRTRSQKPRSTLT